MMRALLLFVALAGCAPRDTDGQHFGPQMPACIISCRAAIEGNLNAQPDSIINTSPKPVTQPATR
jgi:hypothetical protein